MSIILYHTNTPIPKHLNDCITKIKQYSNIPIYLLTDSSYQKEGVTVIDVKTYANSCEWLNKIKLIDSNDPMWTSSSYRFFYIKEFIAEKQLTNVLTFDNDVLLFENPEKIIELLSSDYEQFAVTSHSSDEIVMGMCFIKNIKSIENICNFLQKEYAIPLHSLRQKYQNYPTEMRILGKNNIVDFLPTLPSQIASERFSKNYDKYHSVFDPSSYGQFLGGLPAIHDPQSKPGWYSKWQEIGKNIDNGNIQVIMEDKNPYLIYAGVKIKINNLHIHSKLTERFI